MRVDMNEHAADTVRTIVVAAAWVIILAGWPSITRRVKP